MKSIPDLCKYYKITKQELFKAEDLTLRYFKMHEELETQILRVKSYRQRRRNVVTK
jgi:hypothetical protein